MIRSTLALLALFICIALPAQAAEWTVVKAKSHLSFSVDWQDRPFRGTFKNWDAKITFDPAALDKAKANVTIDIGSIQTGDTEMDDALKSNQGFDVGNFAKATFETTWFRSIGKDKYEARGVLNLHGITRALTLPFTLKVNGNTAQMTGSTRLIRTEFKIGMGQWAAPQPVAHEVTVSMDITATKAQ